MNDTLPPALARRVSLAAQGFGRPHPASTGTRQLTSLLNRLEVLQIDSVNVFERSHYLPVFARLGAFDKATLDALTFRPGRYIEYWGHEATLMPVESWPLFRWRMDAFRAKTMSDPDSWARTHEPFLQWLRDELTEKGPMVASEVEHDANRRTGPWWGWSDVKIGLETLFRWGEIVSAGRSGFERRYAMASDILPAHVLNSDINRADAVRELMRRGAVAHGVGTLDDIADYFRLPVADARVAIAELQDAGEVLPVTVPGWTRGTQQRQAWLASDARKPRSVSVDALLSPFDPIVWARPRAERLFNFRYRIEIYTPKEKRVHGYYVLPVLLDDTLAARVDLKNDRKAGVLRVQASWLEPGAPPDTADRLALLLRRAAAWQGCDEVVVVNRGTLASPLAAALRVPLSDDGDYSP
ncbi:winged helix-turn-helix domain-containing protein [Mycetocola zhadangensis]|uniref:winged helix-turn-helix domain-containing protein n=1 Tax=Mycetocola zhadangensis TaxID=1164595 RepID=UPI003A4E5DE7